MPLPVRAGGALVAVSPVEKEQRVPRCILALTPLQGTASVDGAPTTEIEVEEEIGVKVKDDQHLPLEVKLRIGRKLPELAIMLLEGLVKMVVEYTEMLLSKD